MLNDKNKSCRMRLMQKLLAQSLRDQNVEHDVAVSADYKG